MIEVNLTRRSSLKTGISALFAIYTLLGQTNAVRSSGQGKEVQEGYNIDVDWDEETEIVTFTAILQDNSWMGIVLGNFGMTDSDMILFSANGEDSQFYDLYSQGYFMPREDEENNLEGSFIKVGDEVIFTVTRPLDTGDAKDYLIEPGI